MTDVNRPETGPQTATVEPPQARPAPAAAGDDPLGHLYKMSTTAGLGSTEYVAVNNTAVVAIILGLASALSLLANVLLVVPLAGYIVSLVAFRQIHRSAGTQTGQTLAGAGLLLSMGFLAFVGTRELTAASRTSADRQALATLIERFGQDLRDKKFEDAYQLFTPRFQDRIAQNTFTQRLTPFSENQFYGRLVRLSTNGLANFETDPNTGVRVGEATMIFEYDKIQEQPRQAAVFRIVQGQWRFENIPEVFPTEQQQQQQQQ